MSHNIEHMDIRALPQLSYTSRPIIGFEIRYDIVNQGGEPEQHPAGESIEKNNGVISDQIKCD